MWKKWGVVGLGVMMSWVLACGDDQEEEDIPGGPGDGTGVVLNVEFNGVTAVDVASVDYRVSRCDGSPVTQGRITLAAGNLLEEGLRGERFINLELGCYDLELTPVTARQLPSKDCYVEGVQGLEVEKPGKKDLKLIGQCPGGLDVIAALNSPPVIEKVEYLPSKFVYECEDVEICVTARDPDGDPLEFVFEQTGGQRLWLRPEISRVETDGDRVTACMRTSAVWNDDYEFRVRVYDQGFVNGENVRMENLTGAPSRGELTFPLYTNWDRELRCYDPANDNYHRFAGVREIQRVPGCIPIWPFQYYCSEYHWDETDRTCPDGEFLPETVYPLCEDFPESYYDPEPAPKDWLGE